MLVRLAAETDAAALIALDSVAEYEPQRAAQIRAWCGQGVCYLAEEQGMAMQLGDWYVDPAAFEYNMTITGTVAFTEGTTPDYAVVGAFVGDECRGLGELRYHQSTDEYLVCLFAANVTELIVSYGSPVP